MKSKIIKYPKILLKVEKELEAMWEYEDWPTEAVDTIRKLAKELRKTYDEHVFVEKT